MVRSLRSIALSLVFGLVAGAFAAGCTGGGEEDEAPPPASESNFTEINIPSSSDFPSAERWAIGMINKACDLDRNVLESAVGSTTRVSDGVVYKASRGGRVVASAWARSTFIGASKRCLSRP